MGTFRHSGHEWESGLM